MSKRDLKEELLRLQVEKAALEVAQLEDEIDEARSLACYRRVLTFTGHIEPRSATTFMHTISEWVHRDPESPITVIINSPGGYIFDTLAMYDLIIELRESGTPIDTKVVGYAASGAAVLVQAGNKRIISPNAYIMIHEASTEAWGKASNVRDEVELVERLQERIYDVLARRSKWSVVKIKEKTARRDLWLTADEAKKHGFVDRIG